MRPADSVPTRTRPFLERPRQRPSWSWRRCPPSPSRLDSPGRWRCLRRPRQSQDPTLFRPCILATFYDGSLCRMLTLQGSSLTRNLQFFSIDASLQRFTLALMTTQHNPTVPRRSNPLQIRVTARILPLRHSQIWSLHWMFPLVYVLNLHTSSFFPNLHSVLLCTRSYRSTMPPNRLQWQPFLGMPSSI